MIFEIVIENDSWAQADIKSWARDIVAPLNAALPFDISACSAVIMCCDDAQIAQLNSQFRGKASATNVLSWPSFAYLPRVAGNMPPPPHEDEIGDMAIAFETCMSEAKSANRPIADHMCHLILHGTLHLLGFDHENDSDAEVMEKIEIAVLGQIGISNPYILTK